MLSYILLSVIAADLEKKSQGVGGALYARVQEECKALQAKALFFECLPDDPALSPDKKIRQQNEKRLAFYERFAVFPIIGTRYETPLIKGNTDPPYLLIDLLGNKMPQAAVLQRYVRCILERKYAEQCPPSYIDDVVQSFAAKTVRLRPARYLKTSFDTTVPLQSKSTKKLSMVSNENHEIHHVADHGYVESPVRIKAILKEMETLSFVEKVSAKQYADQHILAVHDAEYISFLKKICMAVGQGKSVYPYVFPIRNQSRKPTDTALLAGYFCIDTFIPLNASAYTAARAAVDCALTAAESLLEGHGLSYALVRPPGHHAQKKLLQYLSNYCKVSILDVDYYHGNSQQNIFYARSDVLTISLHGDPKFAYPYFTGFKDEIGGHQGLGYNINIPLPERLKNEHYFRELKKSLRKINDFQPHFLLVALGLDTAKADPTGTWSLLSKYFPTWASSLAQKLIHRW